MTTAWEDPGASDGEPVLLVAIVAYQGVLADETETFREVFTRVPGARVVSVGDRLGIVAGPGGAQDVDATFADLDQVDVVVVPGGLGSHRHPEIARWLRRTTPRWVLTSSTGSALLAASGLLRGRTAATHWLAGPLLERHGVDVSARRLVVDGPFVTCSGLAAAFDAAFVVVRDIGGPRLVQAIRLGLRESANQLPPPAAPAVRPPRRRRPRTDRSSTGRTMVEVELELTHHRSDRSGSGWARERSDPRPR